MKIIFAVFFLLLFSSMSFAQEVEYGKPSDLKGVKKVFVDCGLNIKSRNEIIKELEKSKIDIEILDSSDSAEVVLMFEVGIDEIIAGNKNGVSTVKRKAGAGIVFIPKGDRRRIILSFDDVKKSVFEKKPETNFAKAFIKAFKEANNL